MRVISLNLDPYFEADEAARESMSPFTSELVMLMTASNRIFDLEITKLSKLETLDVSRDLLATQCSNHELHISIFPQLLNINSNQKLCENCFYKCIWKLWKGSKESDVFIHHK